MEEPTRDIRCGVCGLQGKVAAHDVVGHYPDDMIFPILGKHRPTAFLMFQCPRCKSHLAADPLQAIGAQVMVGNTLDAATGNQYQPSAAARIGCTAIVVVVGGLLIWAVRSGCRSPASEAELQHFRNSITLRNDALKIANSRLPQREKIRAMVRKVERCLSESEKVSDNTLATLHPGLPEHYRNEFCKGVRLWRDGLEKADTALMQSGDMLLERYGDWYVRELGASEGYLP